MNNESLSNPLPESRGRQAEAALSHLLSAAGWRVRRHDQEPDGRSPDMMIRKGDVSYAVEIKAAAEGRGDRLIPLWSQAFLQASHFARDAHPALAVVAAPRISPRVADQVLSFAARFAPDAAAGVLDFEGLRVFRGPMLEDLNSLESASHPIKSHLQNELPDLFSDLNQWMLKVLLAPELPEGLLAAPRGHYHNASQLARAAHVSVMSAFRLLQQLQREGFMHESDRYLRLVRREELFHRWRAASARRVSDAPMRFLLQGDPALDLRQILRGGRACLALYAAADALGLGFVKGIPPHVYVQRHSAMRAGAWKIIRPGLPGEAPNLILRQVPAPQSVFRAVVSQNDLPISDIIQVWLDVSSHPSRGQEQADFIRRRVLDRVIERA